MQKHRTQCDRAPGGASGGSPWLPAACFSQERIVRPRTLLDRGLLDETIDQALLDERIDRALDQVRQLARAVRHLQHLGGVAPLQKLRAARQAVVDVQLTLLGVTVGKLRSRVRSKMDVA